MDTEQSQNEVAAKIAALNDEFRQSMQNCTVTIGVATLAPLMNEIFIKVRDYTDFNEDNDPYGEHDFGSFTELTHKFFWKIDYYDEDMSKWCDPLDERCHRHLTIMLAEEY